jgi:hypothetical protein
LEHQALTPVFLGWRQGCSWIGAYNRINIETVRNSYDEILIDIKKPTISFLIIGFDCCFNLSGFLLFILIE